MTSPIVSFGFDEDIENLYSNGYCWYLALALQSKTNFSVLGVWHKGSIHHVGIQLPNNQIVDIMGVWNFGHWHAFWETEFGSNHPTSISLATSLDPFWATALDLYKSSMLDDDFGYSHTLNDVAEQILNCLEKKQILRIAVAA